MGKPAIYLFVLWSLLAVLAVLSVTGVYQADNVIALLVVVCAAATVLIAVPVSNYVSMRIGDPVARRTSMER